MRRSALRLFLFLAAALTAFGALADRALVRQVATAEELSAARAQQGTRTAALSVRAVLSQIEERLVAGGSRPQVRSETFALPPQPSVATGRGYGGRSREELLPLLLSANATSGGLPEAVVAAIALGAPESRREVAERLVSGQLPVQADDLPALARLLAVSGDRRVDALQTRLRQAPDPQTLPEAPAFRRTFRSTGVVDAWSRSGRAYLHYEAPVEALFAAAGVAGRASVAADTSAPTGGPAAAREAVPEVEGLELVLRPEVASRRRLTAVRALLWLAVAACLGAVGLMQRALAREARAVSREKAFVASVTHELRTPVTAIRVFGETLAEGRGDPRAYGALLAEESGRLEALVERVLAVTRMDEAPRFTAVRPAELLASAVRLMEPRAKRRGVSLGLRADVDLGAACWDADAVRRAVLNLIDNAIKHGRASGAVVLAGVVDGEQVRLSIRDDGPGIGRREQRRLFGRFERGTTEAPGAGLGLYLVDQVARVHGGRVDLTSAPGCGCVFTLILPRQPPVLQHEQGTERTS